MKLSQDQKSIINPLKSNDTLKKLDRNWKISSSLGDLADVLKHTLYDYLGDQERAIIAAASSQFESYEKYNRAYERQVRAMFDSVIESDFAVQECSKATSLNGEVGVLYYTLSIPHDDNLIRRYDEPISFECSLLIDSHYGYKENMTYDSSVATNAFLKLSTEERHKLCLSYGIDHFRRAKKVSPILRAQWYATQNYSLILAQYPFNYSVNMGQDSKEMISPMQLAAWGGHADLLKAMVSVILNKDAEIALEQLLKIKQQGTSYGPVLSLFSSSIFYNLCISTWISRKVALDYCTAYTFINNGHNVCVNSESDTRMFVAAGKKLLRKILSEDPSVDVFYSHKFKDNALHAIDWVMDSQMLFANQGKAQKVATAICQWVLDGANILDSSLLRLKYQTVKNKPSDYSVSEYGHFTFDQSDAKFESGAQWILQSVKRITRVFEKVFEDQATCVYSINDFSKKMIEINLMGRSSNKVGVYEILACIEKMKSSMIELSNNNTLIKVCLDALPYFDTYRRYDDVAMFHSRVLYFTHELNNVIMKCDAFKPYLTATLELGKTVDSVFHDAKDDDSRELCVSQHIFGFFAKQNQTTKKEKQPDQVVSSIVSPG